MTGPAPDPNPPPPANYFCWVRFYPSLEFNWFSRLAIVTWGGCIVDYTLAPDPMIANAAGLAQEKAPNVDFERLKAALVMQKTRIVADYNSATLRSDSPDRAHEAMMRALLKEGNQLQASPIQQFTGGEYERWRMQRSFTGQYESDPEDERHT